jgi:ketol-acid reductoisomerase
MAKIFMDLMQIWEFFKEKQLRIGVGSKGHANTNILRDSD